MSHIDLARLGLSESKSSSHSTRTESPQNKNGFLKLVGTIRPNTNMQAVT